MTSARLWWNGARPRTLVAGVMPVVVGAAASGGSPWQWRFAAALVVTVGLQVGVNLANDAFDGMRGVDTAGRLGPPRLVASGAASARSVLAAALAALGVAAVAGLALALSTSPLPILTIGTLALIAALLYSGGPRPYAGLGLGEVMVFLFFGLMATCGTSFVVGGTVTAAAWWSGAALGLLAVSILVANNLRDIPTDRKHRKRTLAVRMGERGSRSFYVALVAMSFVMAALASFTSPLAIIAVLAAPLLVRPLKAVLGGAVGRGLIPALAGTGLYQLAWSALLALGLGLGRHFF